MPPTPIAVRLMTAADAPAVAILSIQLGYPLTAEVVSERLASVFLEPAHGCFVAEKENTVTGWVHIYGVQMLISPCFFAEIGGLVVDANARRQGIGRALIAHAEAWAAEHGYAEVRLRSGLHRTEAHEFYQGIGYELAKTSHMFRRRVTSE